MLFKKFLTWAFWGQDVEPGWIEIGKKGCFHTNHLTINPVFSKNKVLKATVLYHSKLKDELTDLHKRLQKFIFY